MRPRLSALVVACVALAGCSSAAERSGASAPAPAYIDDPTPIPADAPHVVLDGVAGGTEDGEIARILDAPASPPLPPAVALVRLEGDRLLETSAGDTEAFDAGRAGELGTPRALGRVVLDAREPLKLGDLRLGAARLGATRLAVLKFEGRGAARRLAALLFDVRSGRLVAETGRIEPSIDHAAARLAVVARKAAPPERQPDR